MLSKLRFVSAKLVAYLCDDLWLCNARAANRAAARLAGRLSPITVVSQGGQGVFVRTN